MIFRIFVFTILILFNFIQANPISNKQSQILSKYKIALNYFKKKNYKKSYELLNKLFEENLNDPNINFYLGRSAFEIKKYHDAIIAYERVLFEKPNSSRTKLEMGRAYFLNGSFKEAYEIFKKLKNDPKIPPVILKNIDMYLERADKMIKKYTLNGIVMVGMNYDSNVNNRSEYDIFNNVYIANTYLDMNNTTQDDNVWAHQEVFLINYKYKINNKATIKEDFMLFNKKMLDDKYHSKDVRLYSLTPALNTIHSSKLDIDYAIFFDKMYLDKINTLNTYGLFPKFNYKYDDKNIIKGYYKYQRKTNQKDIDKQKNSVYQEFNLALTNIYSKKILNAITCLYARERKRQDSLVDIDKNIYNIKLNSTTNLNNNLSLMSIFSYKNTKYPDMTTKRIDNEYKISLMSTYIYNSQLLYQFGGDYTKNRSNYDINTYNKHTFTFNLIRQF